MSDDAVDTAGDTRMALLELLPEPSFSKAEWELEQREASVERKQRELSLDVTPI
jgi:hypothetical protein